MGLPTRAPVSSSAAPKELFSPPPRASPSPHCGRSTWLSASAPKAGPVTVRACGLAALGLIVRRWFAVCGGAGRGRRVRWSQYNCCPSRICGRPILLHEEAAGGGTWALGPSSIQSSRPAISHALSTCSVSSHRCSSKVNMALSLRNSCPCLWGKIDTEISYFTSLGDLL